MVSLLSKGLPKGFVYVNDIDPSIQVILKYYSTDNFVGQVINGYKSNKAILTKEAAEALKKAQDEFKKDNYSIVIYDAYRPQKAVEHFMSFINSTDESQKDRHYPYVTKDRFVKEGYVADKSGHSKGSTLDMTLIKIGNTLTREQVLFNRTFNGAIYPYLYDGTIDCGTSFDLMDPISHGDNTTIDTLDPQYRKNRDYIKNIMDKAGFDVLDTEWWHFTLRNQPFPDTYFDFDVE